MFVRIVKLSFHRKTFLLFLENFRKSERIRSAPGIVCWNYTKIKTIKIIFFTYSYWETEQDLEKWTSDFFNEVWSFTKKLFNDKPQAWSVDKLASLE
jgi:heme-degrading monooxygenase HmoA